MNRNAQTKEYTMTTQKNNMIAQIQNIITASRWDKQAPLTVENAAQEIAVAEGCETFRDYRCSAQAGEKFVSKKYKEEIWILVKEKTEHEVLGLFLHVDSPRREARQQNFKDCYCGVDYEKKILAKQEKKQFGY